MDPVCHTLAGAALGEAGLKRRTALGMATLLIGANLPDIDIIAAPLGYNLEFRRGWTHGVLAMVVLPFVLTGIMLAWDRLVRRRGGRVPDRPVVAGQLLLLSTISILSHPALDWLNTYGVRLLMPFAETWYHGDALFIVDPWVLFVLATGIIVARWIGRRRARAGGDESASPLFPPPARAALALVFLYATAMVASSAVARAHVREALRAEDVPFDRVMVAPLPVNPVPREVVVETEEAYLLGRFTWLPRRFEWTGLAIERNATHPAAVAAAGTAEGAAFLRWSRFPYFVVEEETPTRVVVLIADVRYTRGGGGGFATRRVVVEGGDQEPGVGGSTVSRSDGGVPLTPDP